jgi:hypothetical protein
MTLVRVLTPGSTSTIIVAWRDLSLFSLLGEGAGMRAIRQVLRTVAGLTQLSYSIQSVRGAIGSQLLARIEFAGMLPGRCRSRY